MEDCDRVFQWRNHPSVRRFSGNKEEIDFESHKKWFRRTLRNKDQVLLIAVRGGEDVGVIRYDVDPKSKVATMSIYVNPLLHRRGIGTEMMKMGEVWIRKKKPSVRKILATVGKDNMISARLFRGAGFEPAFTVFCKDVLKTHSL